ncbi:MAG: hypothetical protein Q9224_007233, partial [Gallowayella concinna]
MRTPAERDKIRMRFKALEKVLEEDREARRKSTNEDLEAMITPAERDKIRMRLKALEEVLEAKREARRKKSQEQDGSPEFAIHPASFRNDIINAARLQEMDSSSSDSEESRGETRNP